MWDTAEEVETNSLVTYSCGPFHMDKQRQDHQLELTYNSSVAIRNVVLKTCLKQWTIENGGDVTLYGWPAKQTIPLSVLTRNRTKGFWTWNLAVSGSGKGTREESWLEKGADKQLATAHGQGQSTPDTGVVRPVRGDGVQTSERRSSQDESAFQLLCGSFARIHASVSLYMLSEMQCYITPCLALWVNPKRIVRVCSFVLFSPVPSIVFL